MILITFSNTYTSTQQFPISMTIILVIFLHHYNQVNKLIIITCLVSEAQIQNKHIMHGTERLNN